MVTGGEVILKTHSNLAFFRHDTLTGNFGHNEVEIFSGVEFLNSLAALIFPRYLWIIPHAMR